MFMYDFEKQKWIDTEEKNQVKEQQEQANRVYWNKIEEENRYYQDCRDRAEAEKNWKEACSL